MFFLKEWIFIVGWLNKKDKFVFGGVEIIFILFQGERKKLYVRCENYKYFILWGECLYLRRSVEHGESEA